eukprot:TRINITY_DN2378_c0_g1_i2.p1 TRINITY_DN2378_c0_g1~~TRINITY_DN2378_c0_g1_i2.p1  ORF type:complete len:428 (-),score=81.97 TRINITY_DN2378_c0_g1_i2:408-1691(-)
MAGVAHSEPVLPSLLAEAASAQAASKNATQQQAAKDTRGEVTASSIKMLAGIADKDAKSMTVVKDAKSADWTAFAKLMATHFHLVHHPTIYCLAWEKMQRESGKLDVVATLAENCNIIRKENACGRTFLSIIFFPLLCAMPFIYANTMMEFPCEKNDYNYEMQNVTLANGSSLMTLHVPVEECQVELFLQSPLSLLITPFACMLVLAVFFGGTPCVMCWQSCGPDSMISKSMYRKFLPLWALNQAFHAYFRPALTKISLNSNPDAELNPVNFIQKNSYFFAGALYWIMLYIVMVVQFTAVSVINGNVVVGCFVGYGVSELFLRLADKAMGQTPAIAGIVEGEIGEMGETYTSLRTHDSTFIAISSKELKDVASNYPFLGGFVPDTKWLAYMMHVSNIDTVYVTDTNELINVKAGLHEFEAAADIIPV